VKTSALGVLSSVSAIAESDVTNLTTDLAAKAPTASPTFTGTVTTPLTTAGIVKTSAGGVLSSVAAIAESDVTNLVSDLAAKAPTASPTFTGTVTTPLTTAGFVKTSSGGVLSSVAAIAESDVTNLVSDLAAKASLSGAAFTGTITGNLRSAISDKSANYTIVAADAGSTIRSTSTAITITIANVLSVGDRIDFIQYGTGQVTFAAGSGVTLNSSGSKVKTYGQYSGVTVMCVASGIYCLIGDLG
jgi:DNA-binding IscR family transcriptional regulator